MKARGDIFAGEIKFVKDVIRRACFMPHTLRPGCLSAHWGAHLETLARWWMHCTLANMEVLMSLFAGVAKRFGTGDISVLIFAGHSRRWVCAQRDDGGGAAGGRAGGA